MEVDDLKVRKITSQRSKLSENEIITNMPLK